MVLGNSFTYDALRVRVYEAYAVVLLSHKF